MNASSRWDTIAPISNRNPVRIDTTASMFDDSKLDEKASKDKMESYKKVAALKIEALKNI